MAKVILIVEDNPKDLALIRDLLRLSGFTTVEATGGEQGVELAKTKKPDLILMDILMPKVDGYTACREIKMDKATKAIPVVMLTSLDYRLNKALGKMDFATKEKKETQVKVWKRMIGKSFLTKREAFALMGFLRKIK